MEQRLFLGPAEEQYNEIVGTAAADTPDSTSIEALTGLDRDEWTVVGFDISRSRRRWSFDLLAVDKKDLEDRGIAGPGSLVDAIRSGDDEFPFTRFSLPDAANTEAVFDALFKRFSLRLFSEGVAAGKYFQDDSGFVPFADVPADR